MARLNAGELIVTLTLNPFARVTKLQPDVVAEERAPCRTTVLRLQLMSKKAVVSDIPKVVN